MIKKYFHHEMADSILKKNLNSFDLMKIENGRIGF